MKTTILTIEKNDEIPSAKFNEIKRRSKQVRQDIKFVLITYRKLYQ